MRYTIAKRRIAVAAFCVQLAASCAQAGISAEPGPNLDVQAHVKVAYAGSSKSHTHAVTPTVLVWLTSVDTEAGTPHPAPTKFRMIQKNKGFEPHMLVVPLGSTVSFPNLDPFFHNVFSQFNGKRFDLGLYEAGETRDVEFNHEGVSYLFCNIHPGMSAVIVTLATPYYATSIGNSITVLHNVPPGAYEMHVWAEGVDAKELHALARRVHVSTEQTNLGTIELTVLETIPPHKNKFGEDYRPTAPAIY